MQKPPGFLSSVDTSANTQTTGSAVSRKEFILACPSQEQDCLITKNQAPREKEVSVFYGVCFSESPIHSLSAGEASGRVIHRLKGVAFMSSRTSCVLLAFHVHLEVEI